MDKYGKSFAKAGTYALLYISAAAVGALTQPDVLKGAIMGALDGIGAPEVVGSLAAAYVVPVLVSALAGALHQIIKHRDEIFNS